MTPLLQRLREIKAKRGLAFVPYLIPGAPSAEAYAQCMKILSRFGADLYETTIPVSEGWSEHTNETIKSFHRSSRLKLVDSIGVMAEYRPNLCVLYRGTLKEEDFPRLLGKMEGQVDSLILEWNEPEFESYQRECRAHGVEFVHSISPDQAPDEVRRTLDAVTPESFVYLLAAEKTGGSLYPAALLADAVAAIKRYRKDTTVLAGFGIRGAKEIQRLKKVAGLDGVIVGTALLEAIEKGLPAFERLVQEIVSACKGEAQ